FSLVADVEINKLAVLGDDCALHLLRVAFRLMRVSVLKLGEQLAEGFGRRCGCFFDDGGDFRSDLVWHGGFTYHFVTSLTSRNRAMPALGAIVCRKGIR